MAATATKTTTLMDAIKAITVEDLAAVDKEITEKNAELGGLREVRRFMAMKVGVIKKKSHGKRAAGQAATGTDPARPSAPKGTLSEKYRRDVAKWLLEHGNSPTRLSKLADAVGMPDGSASAIIAHPWFTKSDQGYYLSPIGKQEAA